jgi:hypothetical protein
MAMLSSPSNEPNRPAPHVLVWVEAQKVAAASAPAEEIGSGCPADSRAGRGRTPADELVPRDLKRLSRFSWKLRWRSPA